MPEQTPVFLAEIGRRIGRLRRERGLTLTELAHRAGVGKATLSGLEAGTRNPTIETLYAIVGQLEVPMAAILSEAGLSQPGRTLAQTLTQTGAHPPEVLHGTAVSAKLLEVFPDGRTITELYRLSIRPGPTQTSPAHPSGVVEYLTVFSGCARVGPADAPFVVPPGGHGHWAADVPHVYAAVTDEEVHASLIIRNPA
jgi:transcriptional regulator with XRE-family HTH domain